MSRVSIPSLGEVGLQPQARPTNQFYQPEVRQGVGASSDLLGLIQGLSTLNPILQQVSARRFDAEAKNATQRGQNAQAQFGLDNQKALLQAVKDGKIEESQNPWFMVGLKQAVASVEGDKASTDLFDAYNKSDIQHTDDPNAVVSFAQQQLQPLTQGRDAYEMQALAPKLNDSINHLVSYHVNRRAEERQEEMAIASGEELSKTLEQFTPDASPQADLLTKNGIAGWAAEKGKFLKRDTLNNIIVDTAKANALATGNAQSFSKALSAIETTGGKTLADTAQNKLLYQQIQAEIIGRSAASMHEEDYLRKRQAEDAANSVMHAMITDLDETRQHFSGADMSYIGYDINWVDHQEATGTLNHDTSDLLRQMIVHYQGTTDAVDDRKYEAGQRQIKATNEADKAAKDTGTQAISDRYGKLVASGQKIPATTLVDMLHNASKFGFTAIHDVQQNAYDYNQTVSKQESDPVVLKEIQSAYLDKSLTPAFLRERRQGLSDHDFETFIPRALENAKSDGSPISTNSALTKEIEYLGQRVFNPFVTASGTDLEKFKSESPGEYAGAEQRASTAQNDLFDSFSSWLSTDEGKKADESQRLSKMHELSDKIGDTYQASTRQAMQQQAVPKPAPAAVKVDKNRQPTFPEIENVAKTDPVLSKLNFPNLDLMTKIGATPAKLDETRGNMSIHGSLWKELTQTNPSLADPLNTYFRSIRPADAHTVSGGEGGRGVIIQNQAGNPVAERDKAMKFRLALKSALVGNKTTDDINAVTDELQSRNASGQFFITDTEKKKLITRAAQVQQYALLTQNVGITVAEAKAMGEGAYLSLPMFADENDLKANADRVVSQLGLNPEDAIKFVNYQRIAIHRVHTNAAIQSGQQPS